MDARELLNRTAAHAADFLESLDDRPVAQPVDVGELRERLGGPLPDGPSSPEAVLDRLVEVADEGIVASPSGRFFGFVIGGATPVAVAADWMTSVWDQNAGLYVSGPSASVVEEISARWLAELLGLPEGVSSAFVTGTQMAHATALAAARFEVLRRAGWDVNEQGIAGSPPIRVVVGAERHVTVDRALRLLGIGTTQLVVVPADEQGRIRADALPELGGAPTILCAQAGNVNTGSFDPIPALADVVEGTAAWLHVDGAFGLWAAAVPELRHLVAGVERADSWTTDAHKWLNVPYDSGIAFCAHPDAHRAAMSVTASYLIQADEGGPRDQMDWTPEFSRRARGFPIYAALRTLGRSGVSELVERCCAHARRFGELLAVEPEVEILNDVVLNQVLVRFGDSDERTDEIGRLVRASGEAWLSGTRWHSVGALRISVSNWRTTEADVELAVRAILEAVESTRPAAVRG
ncbi:MAG: pyridoxal-dependent decarboxylase [Actinomycetota bacterium]|nr:pyridoxal-dependent decarboxylase [Actinomycetota bacterium]